MELVERRTLGAGPLTEVYEQALLFAAAHHRQQMRKGSQIPYLSHLMSVSALVLEYGGSDILLYDVRPGELDNGNVLIG